MTFILILLITYEFQKHMHGFSTCQYEKTVPVYYNIITTLNSLYHMQQDIVM